jgi:phosphoserine phosphatase RsbU/P
MSKLYKILIADDSAAVRNSVQHILMENAENTYSVLIAGNGREACTIAYHEKPDLILIDIEMPIMNGIDAIKKIKSNNLINHIPIIVMSSTRQFQEAFSAGADDFLFIPFNTYELLMRIHLNLKLAEKGYEVNRQHELLKAQRQEAINQRDIIINQKTELMDDLRYARFIQYAILPSSEVLNDLFAEHFIYNQPKNIVSGDFYWVTRKKGMIIVAVGDCTGHGMSGALMTMAGAAFLNEIVIDNTQLNADQVLNDLRKRVIQLLNQKGDIGEASNGMDIALCIYNETKHTLQFAGANNLLYIARKDGTLETIKGDRMPIGFYFDNQRTFTKVDIQVSKGDMMYLFSDGYADQFGGPLGKKFRYNQFRDLISKAASSPSMKDQLELVKTTMDNWIDGYEQIDDMLILGIKF